MLFGRLVLCLLPLLLFFFLQPEVSSFTIVVVVSRPTTTTTTTTMATLTRQQRQTRPQHVYYMSTSNSNESQTDKSNTFHNDTMKTTTGTATVVVTARHDENRAADNDEKEDTSSSCLVPPPPPPPSPLSFWQNWWTSIQSEYTKRLRPPPWQVEDVNVVLYDIILLVNLVVSIDVWVIHRMQFGTNLVTALNEGCVVSTCWLVAGLGTGAFLHSAVDGHWPSTDDRAGPLAAARLALYTFVNTCSLRLLLALATAMVQHRPVLLVDNGAEALLPLELGLGVALMPLWRWLHSSYTPRF